MSKIRVMIVDDSVVFRRLVADVLSEDPGIEVAATAPNGRVALAKLTHANPDLVILDVEMPEMDGLATLAGIRRVYPDIPVIMFSALTELGATITLEALTLGATDYFTKPAGVGGLDASMEVLRRKLVPEIKTLCARRMAAAGIASPAARPRDGSAFRAVAAPPPRMGSAGEVELVVIGTSTGGPNALAAVIPELPADFPAPVLIVQHMPPVFTARLAERLHSLSKLPVAEAVSGAVVSPGKAWIAPGDRHMAVVRDGTVLRLLTHQDPPENSCRPAVDVLFRSAARTCGAGTLAVIMTGMGKDGLRGCEAVRVAGGRVLAQDEATSVVWGMPGVVAEAGLADQVLPLDRIGGEIVRCFRPGRAGAMHAMPMPVPAAMPGAVSGIPQAAAAAAGAAETAEAP